MGKTLFNYLVQYRVGINGQISNVFTSSNIFTSDSCSGLTKDDLNRIKGEIETKYKSSKYEAHVDILSFSKMGMTDNVIVKDKVLFAFFVLKDNNYCEHCIVYTPASEVKEVHADSVKTMITIDDGKIKKTFITHDKIVFSYGETKEDLPKEWEEKYETHYYILSNEYNGYETF